jgi:hypothetical protein
VPGDRETAGLHALAAFDLREGLSGGLHGAQEYDGVRRLDKALSQGESRGKSYIGVM